jgi:hypothetical protein
MPRDEHHTTIWRPATTPLLHPAVSGVEPTFQLSCLPHVVILLDVSAGVEPCRFRVTPAARSERRAGLRIGNVREVLGEAQVRCRWYDM